MKQLIFPDEYFKTEVRDGFAVNELMKRTWAAQLEVLNQIIGICDKYGLTYYADCGTLLGAVRHKGYIPWDDDLDIAMKKEDYIRFLEVAKEEFPKDYWIANCYTTDGYEYVTTRISNIHATDFSEKTLSEYHGCPFRVGVDIFPLYYLSRDAHEAEMQKNILQDILGLIHLLENEQMEGNVQVAEELVKLEKLTGYRFTTDRPLKTQLWILFDQVSRLFEEEESDSLTVFTRRLRNGYYVEKELLAECMQMPFENLIVNVPKGYDEILKRLYGNYTVPRRVSLGHDYPYYKGQLKRLGGYIEEQDCAWKAEQKKDLPVEWQRKIGSRKVVLYYTGADALMCHSEFAADKLKAVFETFKNDSDVILWWFPCVLDNPKAPFIRQMSPQLVKDYHQMMEEYKREDFGILDLSGNRQRAVSMADSYYGDESELSQMFRKTGKCVTIQDYTKLEEKKDLV